MAFEGKRVLSLESRRSVEVAELIRKAGGDPFVAPSMREVPIEDNPEAVEFADGLLHGAFDMVIFLTGVGARLLASAIARRYSIEEYAEGLRKVVTVVRGPKPLAALREIGVPATVRVPEPNTWRELLAAIAGRPERRVALQEYGKSNADLLDALRARGGEVSIVRVYQWRLPEDTAPLEQAARGLAEGRFDLAMFTTSTQVDHLEMVAGRLGIRDRTMAGLRAVKVASIGPTTSETLREHGVEPALEASHPKLGFLVKEASELA